MSQTEVIVQGTLTADGTLLLDEKPNLPPGRVQVVLRQDTEAKKPASLGSGFFQMMEEIWAGQRARGHVPRSGEEVEAERRALRGEVEDEIEAAIRLQRGMPTTTATGGKRDNPAMMVCLDTNIVISCVEGDPLWKPRVEARFRALAAAGDTLASSDATRLECLVGPLQAGDAAVFADYQKFFASPEVRMLPVTVAVWERAARIRSAYKFQALDSIHLATAIEHGCGLFLTSDTQLARCNAIAVEVLQ